MTRRSTSILFCLLLCAALVLALALPSSASHDLFTEYPIPTKLSNPMGITAGPDGAVWFTEMYHCCPRRIEGHKIGRITVGGDITEYAIPSVGCGPWQIVTGPDGALWFTEIDGHKIGRITTEGVITEYKVPTSGAGPAGITVGPDGALWFTEMNVSQIGRITVDGEFKEFLIPRPGCVPWDIVSGPDGALWFTDIAGDRIGRITTTGQVMEYKLPTPGSGPAGITVGPDGALWFTEVDRGRIGRITTAGKITEYQVPTEGCAPWSIVAGPDGALWFTEIEGNKLGRITAAGKITEHQVPTDAAGPAGITLGPEGSLWFTEINVDQVGRFGPVKALGSTKWFIAEGSTGGGFDTWLLLQNPGGHSAEVLVTFATDEGPEETIEVEIEPESRATVRVADYVPGKWGVSTIIDSTEPVVAERSMYWDSRLLGEGNNPGDPQPYEMRSGHANLGVPESALSSSGVGAELGKTHYFPEGATAGGFDTWVLLVNPNDTDTVATVTLMTDQGSAVEKDVVVEALSRETVHLDDYLPDAFEVATQVSSDLPLVAERSMYWDPGERDLEPYQMAGGHSNAGSPAQNTSWFLAEGSTGGGFDTYILVQNPGDEEANVNLSFSNEEGIVNQVADTMMPKSRATFKVSDYVPDEFQVSTTVVSDRPVVAERSMYWDKRVAAEPYQMRDGHSTVGLNAASGVWMVPEGSTSGGFDSFVLLSNIGDSDVDTSITFMTEKGPMEPVNITIGANSRNTIRVSDYVPLDNQVSTLVVSGGLLVVERAMYWDRREQYPFNPYDIRPYEMMGGHSASGLDP